MINRKAQTIIHQLFNKSEKEYLLIYETRWSIIQFLELQRVSILQSYSRIATLECLPTY
jgi:hypothetical protein